MWVRLWLEAQATVHFSYAKSLTNSGCGIAESKTYARALGGTRCWRVLEAWVHGRPGIWLSGIGWSWGEGGVRTRSPFPLSRMRKVWSFGLIYSVSHLQRKLYLP